MIYLALANSKIDNVSGILTPEIASNYFYRSFIDDKAARRHIINEFLPDSHPNADFKELVFGCSQKGLLLYKWDTSDITPADIILIGKHIHTLDWYQLIDESIEFYQACIVSRGKVHEDSLSDLFIHDHYYLLELDDIEFSENDISYISVYDWVRKTRGRLFEEIENKLLIKLDNEYSFDDVLEDVKALIATNVLNEDIDLALENIARKSKYYGLVPYSHLVSVIKHAIDESSPKQGSSIVQNEM